MIIINNTTAGATNAGVIDMQPGEYLMDVINAINALPENEKPTESNPLTINMYNHNFTVDYDRITAKVVIPKHVFIHLAGNYYGLVWNDDQGEDAPLPQKSFIGFDFSVASPRSLPMKFLVFSPFIYGEVELEADIPNGSFDEYLGATFVYARDTKKLLLVRGAEIIDVTVILQDYTVDDALLVKFYFADCKGTNFNCADCKSASFSYTDCNGADFRYADCKSAYFSYTDCKGASFDYADCKSAYFHYADFNGARFRYADCKGAYFSYTDCKGASFDYADCKGATFESIQLNNQCNFQGTNLTNVQNMPAALNTKAKFISVVGAGNVNAQTIWIDGTSILS